MKGARGDRSRGHCVRRSRLLFRWRLNALQKHFKSLGDRGGSSFASLARPLADGPCSWPQSLALCAPSGLPIRHLPPGKPELEVPPKAVGAYVLRSARSEARAPSTLERLAGRRG